MQIKTGTDIIEVERIRKSINDMNDKFINQIFTDKEKQYCDKSKATRYQHYAARFAAKEATFKAISTLLDDKYSVSWKNIEVSNDKNGKPNINFVSLEKDIEKKLQKINSIDVSLSHLETYAIANVTILIN